MAFSLNKYVAPLTVLKVVISAILVALPGILAGNILAGLLEWGELLAAYFGVLVLGRHLRILGYLFSSLTTSLIVAQEWVHYFSGSYTTKLMLDNIVNVTALGPSLPKYIALFTAVLIISFLPVKIYRYPRAIWRGGLVLIVAIFFGLVFVSRQVTALRGTLELARAYQQAAATSAHLAEISAKPGQTAKKFEKSSVAGGINVGVKNPNVIVIFAEGTSRKTIESTQSHYPGLMPNLLKFSQESDNFVNYFNSTAATYRGLRSQLNSSFQYYEGYENAKTKKLINQRTNTPLISVPTILKKHGYASSFVNPEPDNSIFADYLDTLGFDKVVSGPRNSLSESSTGKFLTDKNNLNLLFNQAEQFHASNKHFIVGTYTLQTHNGWNVTDNQYGNGKNAVLNKFHNLDAVFGQFLNKFMASDLKNNTILIFTTDHASYASPDYASTMNDTRDAFVSTVPLMIYYPGVKPQTIDVRGRNSLGLAPTILDLLNIDQSKNYFLGTSLYTNKPSEYEHISQVDGDFYSTKKGTVTNLPKSQNSVKKKILDYESFSLNMN
ncbi:LTA synthase family protein [Lacticaseibacillus sp. 866-1]|uniref:LTA synthase family protein n=1 Tax=Lacticaseibacillus sp. 866-1 TaxID=2799576 RepID=UPI001EF3A67A|nr:sulfatase-like hydrolase/transferase [Lacticaseibacillus sp. 866-1]